MEEGVISIVQIGNFHVGTTETAKSSTLTAAEAHFLWDNLLSRYDIVQATQLYLNHVHDKDFSAILSLGLRVLDKQIIEMEKEMKLYGLPLPERRPKSVEFFEDTSAINDQYIFKRLFTGVQSFLENHIRSIRVMVYNKHLRKMNIAFLKKELDIYNDLCKYGKVKGWLVIPPMYFVK
jgi:hypothetical protein